MQRGDREEQEEILDKKRETLQRMAHLLQWTDLLALFYEENKQKRDRREKISQVCVSRRGTMSHKRQGMKEFGPIIGRRLKVTVRNPCLSRTRDQILLFPVLDLVSEKSKYLFFFFSQNSRHNCS
jgi:hypothetical protein